MGEEVPTASEEVPASQKHEDTIEGVHPSNLEQQTPYFIEFIYNCLTYVITYCGWYVLLFCVVSYLIWNKYKDRYYEWKDRQEKMRESAEIHKNPDKFIERERALENARKRLQEKYDEVAAEHNIKMKEKEKEKRQENPKQGIGSYNRLSNGTTDKTSSGKPRLRPEYNPLMGAGGSSSWRPETRRQTGGG